MWFCVTANAQNLGVIFNLPRIRVLYGSSIRSKLKITPRFWHSQLHKTTYRDPPDPFFPYPNTKERKRSGHKTTTIVQVHTVIISCLNRLKDSVKCIGSYISPQHTSSRLTSQLTAWCSLSDLSSSLSYQAVARSQLPSPPVAGLMWRVLAIFRGYLASFRVLTISL